MSSRIRSYHPTKLARALKPRGSQARLSDPPAPSPEPPRPSLAIPEFQRPAQRPTADIFVPPPRPRAEAAPAGEASGGHELEGASLRSTLRAGTFSLAKLPPGEEAPPIVSETPARPEASPTASSELGEGTPAAEGVNLKPSSEEPAEGGAEARPAEALLPGEPAWAHSLVEAPSPDALERNERDEHAALPAPSPTPELPLAPFQARPASAGDLGEHADFFANGEGSLAPVTDLGRGASELPEIADEDEALAPSPVALERRARFRRMVSAAVAFTGVVALAVIGNAVASGGKRTAAALPTALTAPPLPAAPQPAAVPEAVAETVPAVAAPSATPSATPEEPALADEPSAERDPEKAKALKKEALGYLNRGNFKGAIESARASIAADPTDALPYLYLGSALQDTGKWKEGREAFNECVRNATKGPVYECRAMGGRK